MSKLKYLKQILSVLDLDTAISQYSNVLRYLIKKVQAEGFSEGRLATYVENTYPKIPAEDIQYLVQLVGRNYKNKAFLQKVLQPNTPSGEVTKIDRLKLQNILKTVAVNFEGLLTSGVDKDKHLEALTEGILELERTIQACSEGLDKNKIIELH